MLVKDLEKLLHNDLDILYGKEEVSSFFVLILEHYYKITRLELALDPNLSITKKEQDVFFEALNALKQEVPIQYILGSTEFYGLPFKVNKNTLIPRPETEELVSWSIKCLKSKIKNIKKSKNKQEVLNVLDIGTGSGCVAIALAKNVSNVKVYALDVSLGALKVARHNADLNGVVINFINTDILKQEAIDLKFENLKFDIIISNPPYVLNKQKMEMKANVLNNEPHLALFVDDENPLLFYKKIAVFAKKKLNHNGALFFEINEYLGLETKQLVERHNFKNIKMRKDSFGKDRMLKASKKDIKN